MQTALNLLDKTNKPHKISQTRNPPMNNDTWTPSSYKTKPILQQAEYPDQTAYLDELSKLKSLPPIVSADEVNTLRKTLIDAQHGKAFILQVGDCAEKFSDCSTQAIHHKVLFYDLLGNLFTKITNTPTVVIGRMAGQFAKPRSETHETVDGKKVMSFKGENINGYHAHERVPCPKRMTEGYEKSVAVMADIRQLKEGEIFCPHFNEKVQKINSVATNSQDLLEEMGFSEPIPLKEKTHIHRDMYISHEALLLDYEETQVRESHKKFYNLSAHFLWIGMRTNCTSGAHVEFFRGLENPIGVKLSKEIASNETELKKLIDMIKLLNPKNEEGKLILITRFGARYVEETLPKVMHAVANEDLKVMWVVDAVHGNTQKVGNFKTRKLCDVRDEIIKTIQIFKKYGSILHGVHLELTPEEVTECLGGSFFEIREEDLGRNYTSYCDPRLNFSQSVELIATIGQEINKE